MAKNAGQRATLGKILRRVRTQWPALLVSLVLAVTYVLVSLYIPILIGKAIDNIVAAGKVDFNTVIKYLWDILAYTAVAGIAQWLMSALNNRVTYRITKQVRDEAFSHLQKLPLSYLDKHAHGDIISRVITDVDAFADGLLMGFTQLFSGVITILGTLIIMLTISWEIALVVICITPLSLLVANFIAKSTYNMFRQQTTTRGEQTALIDETIGQLKTVRAFGHQRQSMESFDEINQRLETQALQAIFFSSLTNPATRFVNSVVYAGVGLVGAMVAISGGITVGNLTSFLNYANQYTKPFNEISGVITELQNAIACAGRVFDLIDVEPMTQDPETSDCPEKITGSVVVDDLHFSYSPDKIIFDGLSLRAEAGQKVAIVGPTGCGKTTLINLLMRFYEPESGEILLDGIPVSGMSRGVLRKNIGMVLQDTWLKAGTIRENIAMGRPDATEEEIILAAKQAHAHSFIKRLPKGYDTMIGEQGGSLSQGQKQLLCIARVMLCCPPMLFLDEATSSIDTRTEMRIQKAFDTLMEGRTSFIVAHRLSTIREADCILVMKDGCIIESGTHHQLLEAGGFYAELYKSQFAH